MDFSDIRASKKTSVIRVWVPLEPGLKAEYEDLEDELTKAERADRRSNDRDTAPAVRAQLEDVEMKIAESRVAFSFKALGRKDYNDLLRAHQPNRVEDKALGFDPETFPPALLAATAVDPTLTTEEALSIWEDWSDAEATELFQGAMKANRQVADVPFTKDGIAMETLATVAESITPSSEVSPTPGS